MRLLYPTLLFCILIAAGFSFISPSMAATSKDRPKKLKKVTCKDILIDSLTENVVTGNLLIHRGKDLNGRAIVSLMLMNPEMGKKSSKLSPIELLRTYNSNIRFSTNIVINPQEVPIGETLFKTLNEALHKLVDPKSGVLNPHIVEKADRKQAIELEIHELEVKVNRLMNGLALPKREVEKLLAPFPNSSLDVSRSISISTINSHQQRLFSLRKQYAEVEEVPADMALLRLSTSSMDEESLTARYSLEMLNETGVAIFFSKVPKDFDYFSESSRFLQLLAVREISRGLDQRYGLARPD